MKGLISTHKDEEHFFFLDQIHFKESKKGDNSFRKVVKRGVTLRNLYLCIKYLVDIKLCNRNSNFLSSAIRPNLILL